MEKASPIEVPYCRGTSPDQERRSCPDSRPERGPDRDAPLALPVRNLKKSYDKGSVPLVVLEVVLEDRFVVLPTESEVIRDGLRALLVRDRAIESWLHHQIGPAYDALKADPPLSLSERALPVVGRS